MGRNRPSSPRRAPGSALAKPSRAKGPLVWLDMDQQELDDAYDQLVYAPNRDQVGKRRIANSERTRTLLGAPQRVGYGASEIEKLDIYRARSANAPVNIFVHGGRVAGQSGGGLCIPGRAVRQCRRPLRHPRLHQCR